MSNDVPHSCARELLENLGHIERTSAYVARRHRLAAADVDDFVSFVKERLIENDYWILRKFERRSSLLTYLTTVIANLYHDFTGKISGRWRPSAKARSLGEVAILLEQLLARDHYAFDEAWQIMSINHGLDLSRAEVERLAGLLPPRTSREFVPVGDMDVPGATPTPDAAIHGREMQALRERCLDALRAVRGRLVALDQAVLAYRFEDGLTVAAIAVTLGLDQKRLYRRLEALYAKMRAELRTQGVGLTECFPEMDW